MKIEKKLNGEYILSITEKEFKKAFSSEDNYKKFKDRTFDLLMLYHLINDKSNK